MAGRASGNGCGAGSPKHRGGLSISADTGASGDPERLSSSSTGSRDLNLRRSRRRVTIRKAARANRGAHCHRINSTLWLLPSRSTPMRWWPRCSQRLTNPDQIAYADDWLAQNRNLTGAALAQAVDQQSWDPSVKALTQFPSVLDNLAHNLSWTSSLGQAFANQQADVMAAVQAMRAKAQAAGTLQSSSQITVTQPAANTIVIQPANPQVVYVPQYNPAVVYGAPVVVPFYVPPPLPVASVGLYFGTGITIGATFGGGGWGGGFGWGWHAWNVNWGGGWGGGGGSTTSSTTTTPISTTTPGTTGTTTAITPGEVERPDRKIMPGMAPTAPFTPTVTTSRAKTRTMARTAVITRMGISALTAAFILTRTPGRTCLTAETTAITG